MAERDIAARVVDIVLFDGKVVGEPGKGGKVKAKTCPDWFPSVIAEGGPGEPDWKTGSLRALGDKIYIGLSSEKTLTIRPGDWLVKEADSLLVADGSVGDRFEDVVANLRYVCPISALEVPVAPE